MSKLLSTGEMIEKLKLGERAQRADGDWNYEIYRSINGVFLENGKALTLDSDFLKAEWNIIPTYVTFEEAMKALKKGKKVHCYPKDTVAYDDGKITNKTFKETRLGATIFEEMSLEQLVFDCKWTIEEG